MNKSKRLVRTIYSIVTLLRFVRGFLAVPTAKATSTRGERAANTREVRKI